MKTLGMGPKKDYATAEDVRREMMCSGGGKSSPSGSEFFGNGRSGLASSGSKASPRKQPTGNGPASPLPRLSSPSGGGQGSSGSAKLVKDERGRGLNGKGNGRDEVRRKDQRQQQPSSSSTSRDIGRPSPNSRKRQQSYSSEEDDSSDDDDRRNVKRRATGSGFAGRSILARHGFDPYAAMGRGNRSRRVLLE